ncbi:DUF4432 family protein [Taklimakanibacter lacteus]|uniref:DUF4432 family protein n=1 Tax=Taklimakanibacter lacteus TaxID=2268456 RepID=UPI000E67652A
MTKKLAQSLSPLVGTLRQIATVRRIVLDDGPENGVRALSFSTGGGLEFLALSDRTLDIGTLSWQGIQIAWQSPAGFRTPALIDLESEGGRGFNRGFSGFLITCGLNHIRQPANGEPLHGRLPFTPARLTAYGEDWDRDEPLLYCEGEVVQARYGGEALRLRRRIEAPVGGGTIRITDMVENLGAEICAQEMLYHFNLGYPGIAPGTTVELDGQNLLGPIELPDDDGLQPARTWPAQANGTSRCTVVTPSGERRLSVSFSFDTRTLSHLQLWRDLRRHTGVLAIEPCSSPLAADGKGKADSNLAPGERRTYRLEITLSGSPRPLNLPDRS